MRCNRAAHSDQERGEEKLHQVEMQHEVRHESDGEVSAVEEES